MTFIVAIQLNDSIIVASDKKKVTLREDRSIQLCDKKFSKLHAWDKGIITGTGESYVISRSVELFKKIAHSDINKLPQCLDLSRQIREQEIGTKYFQVENTKLLCSSYSQQGAQLYKIERFNLLQPYTLTAIEPMDITVWLFHPNINAISTNLQDLYSDLKDYAMFTNQMDWMNYYINRIAPIYKKQSKEDAFMSQSFDIFFQTKDEYIIGHIPNTQHSALNFYEISAKSDSI